MPPTKDVRRLSDLSKDYVYEWIHNRVLLENKGFIRMKQRDYINKIFTNNKLKEEILEKGLSVHTYKVSCSSKCNLLEQLGNQSTKSVDISNSGPVFVDEAFQLYRTLAMSNSSNIIELGINCKFMGKDEDLVEEVNTTLHMFLETAKYLQRVTLIGVADHKSLRILGTYCRYLEYVDVRSSKRVDDQAIASFLLGEFYDINGKSEQEILAYSGKTNPCSNMLTEVRIASTNTTVSSAFLLLHLAPNLKTFGGDTNDSTCEAIAMVQQNGDPVLLKLEYICDSRILVDHAMLLDSVCPNLTNISMCIQTLPSLVFLRPLKCLTVNVDYQLGSDKVYDYLCTHGEVLTQLILENDVNNPIELEWIIEFTPNLEYLKANVKWEDEDEYPNWNKLKKMFVTIRSSYCMKMLCKHAPALEEIHMHFRAEPYKETCSCINDELINTIVSEGSLSQLRKLFISECDITQTGIDMILLNCTNLQQLGYFYLWSRLTEKDIKMIKNNTLKNNWNLELFEHNYEL